MATDGAHLTLVSVTIAIGQLRPMAAEIAPAKPPHPRFYLRQNLRPCPSPRISQGHCRR